YATKCGGLERKPRRRIAATCPRLLALSWDWVQPFRTPSPIFSPEMGWMKFLRVELRIFSPARLGTRAAMFFDHGERLGRVCHSLWRRISPWWPSAKRGLLARDVVQQRRADHAAANRGFHG